MVFVEQIHIPRLRPEGNSILGTIYVLPFQMDWVTVDFRFMENNKISANEQLAECKEEVAAVKQDLAEVRDAASSNDQLMKSGLRLAMENAVLRGQIAELRDEKSETGEASVADYLLTLPGRRR